MAVYVRKKVTGDGLVIAGNIIGVTSADKFQSIRRKQFLYVFNNGAGSTNVTIDGNPDVVVAIPSTQKRIIGPFDDLFEDSSGFVNVSYSVITAVDAMAADIAEGP